MPRMSPLFLLILAASTTACPWRHTVRSGADALTAAGDELTKVELNDGRTLTAAQWRRLAKTSAVSPQDVRRASAGHLFGAKLGMGIFALPLGLYLGALNYSLPPDEEHSTSRFFSGFFVGASIGAIVGGGLGLLFGYNHQYIVDPSQFTFGVAPQPGGGAVFGVGVQF